MYVDTILHGDALATLKTLPDACVQCVVTSPPYFGQRDYGVPGQLGLETTPAKYVEHMIEVFAGVRRVLRDDGTLWLNLGDSYCTRSVQRDDGMRSVIKNYAGSADLPNWSDYAKRGRARYSSSLKASGLKDKDLIGIPWMVAFALRADGWYLRSDIIWAKKNCMPESVTDRPTRSHEYLFLLSKRERYYYDTDSIREPHLTAHAPRAGVSSLRGQQSLRPRSAKALTGSCDYHPAGRNKRSVWTVATVPYGGAHFATFPPALIEPCILAGAPAGGLVLDPFMGAGTTAVVARRHSRHYLGIELNAAYITLAEERIAAEVQPVLWTA